MIILQGAEDMARRDAMVQMVDTAVTPHPKHANDGRRRGTDYAARSTPSRRAVSVGAARPGPGTRRGRGSPPTGPA